MHPCNPQNAVSHRLAGFAVVLLPLLLGASTAAGEAPDASNAPHVVVAPAYRDTPPAEVRRASYLMGWRVALTRRAYVEQPTTKAPSAPAETPPQQQHFAPEFDLVGVHVFVQSVAFGGERFYALDTGRTSFPDWPCDADCYALFSADPPPRVYAYTITGDRDTDIAFEPHQHDAADYVRAIEYADDRLYVLNVNPPKVHAYTLDGARVPGEDFYLAGGEHHRTWDGNGWPNCCPADFAHADGRFYVLDQGTNNHAPKVFVYDTAGRRDRAAEFQIDGLRYEMCGTGAVCEYPTHIVHADGALYVKVRVPNSAVDVPVWRYSMAGAREGTLNFGHSALFTYGMTYANDWLYLLSHINIRGLQRICAYTTQGKRVMSTGVEPTGRFCETPSPTQGVAGG